MKSIGATDVARASACAHAWTLECFGDPAARRAPDAGLRRLFERGAALERERVRALGELPRPAGVEDTLSLLRGGAAWVYQGRLELDGLRGRPDLLKRIEVPSKLGAFSYIPMDVKSHQGVEKKDRLQLAFYAKLLEPILGARPAKGAIWPATGEPVLVELERERAGLERLLARMARIRDGAESTVGRRSGECASCAWRDHCGAEWEAREDVSLIYGAAGEAAERLAAAGFATWRAVAAAPPDVVGEKIWLHARARLEGRPLRRKAAAFPADRPIHFYDIETYEGTVYLHGVVRVEGTSRRERQYFADDPADEGRAWRELLEDFAGDPRALVYCWSNYERGFAAALWEKHGGNPAGWALLRDALVDQCGFVKAHFALPVSGYGIKKVAPLFGFRWDAADAGGLNSEAWYGEWLRTRDPAWREKLLRYNLDDVRAMEVVDRELRKLP